MNGGGGGKTQSDPFFPENQFSNCEIDGGAWLGEFQVDHRRGGQAFFAFFGHQLVAGMECKHLQNLSINTKIIIKSGRCGAHPGQKLRFRGS